MTKNKDIYPYEFDSCDGVVYNDDECLPKKDVVDIDIPEYYIGKTHRYEARKVVEDFELSYNLGTAVTYLLRARRKHKSPVECITKAMAHLKFELEKIENEQV
jgi:hypothetical protein|tara:strand:- start:17350 stop:17658 length:309 start_codon:yes stop_codon:yes gene_type:complete